MLPRLRVVTRRVEQVLANLIENAAHAVVDVARPSIELRARTVTPLHTGASGPDAAGPTDATPSSRFVALEVIDNGSGVDPENVPSLFDPFYTTKDPGKGTGLGLWNCERIALLLGGRVEVASSPGRTCFSLILPAADSERGEVLECPAAGS